MEDTNLSRAAVWNRIRRLKTGFRERRQRLKHNGKLVPWSQTHSTFTQRLKNVQWTASQVTPEELDLLRESPPINPTDPEPIRAITMSELQGALRKLKRNKAPGLDGIKQDVLRLMDYYAETKLLQLLNECLTSGKIPKDWKQARIVCIYKNKGSPSLPENYRPISLLNTLYKFYASILQARLAERHDKHLRNTQYGFRAERSTTDPMFIMRRAQDYSAKTGHPLYLLFLDWRTAFDKVDHSAMLIALERFGVHPTYVNIIRDMYDHPEFCTSAPDGSLSWGEAQTGIRQGCPLSPYLFIMVMSVMFSDIDKNLMAKGVPTNTWSTGKPVYDLEYADDTLIMALTSSQLQDLLSAVQVKATLYNMFLNSTKTEILANPRHPLPQTTFANGDPVPVAEEVKYLGAKVTWDNPTKVAIKDRQQKGHIAYCKLQHMWRSRLCWKAKVRLFIHSPCPYILTLHPYPRGKASHLNRWLVLEISKKMYGY